MKDSLMKKCVEHLASAKSEQNVLAALDIYHPDARLISIGLDIEARGSAEIEQQLQTFFSLFPDYRVELNQVACNEQWLLAIGDVYLTPCIPERVCNEIHQPCAFAFKFKDGQIFEEEFFLDFGQVCQKSNISPTEFREAINTHVKAMQSQTLETL